MPETQEQARLAQDGVTVREILRESANKSHWYEVKVDREDMIIRVYMDRGMLTKRAMNKINDKVGSIEHFSVGDTASDEHKSHIPIDPHWTSSIEI